MQSFKLGNYTIGNGHPPFIIGELSANHTGSLTHAKEIIHAISEAGAHAVKLQTYTADTLTIDCSEPPFIIGKHSLWKDKTLYQLYQEANTPWKWHEELFNLAYDLKLECFSTPFDKSSVDFLETFNPPAYKIASFEMIDIGLIDYVASKNRPIIMSTGMGSLTEITESVQHIQNHDVPLALLKCTSAYPTLPEYMNIKTIQHLNHTFNVPVGLSDHTLGISVPIAAIALGANIIEKHVTLDRKIPGPDSAFSLEPEEFKLMVKSVNEAYQSLGKINYGITEAEKDNTCFRRSLFLTEDIEKGQLFTENNVKSIRPGYGLPPKFLNIIIGKTSSDKYKRGTPITWSMLS